MFKTTTFQVQRSAGGDWITVDRPNLVGFCWQVVHVVLPEADEIQKLEVTVSPTWERVGERWEVECARVRNGLMIFDRSADGERGYDHHPLTDEANALLDDIGVQPGQMFRLYVSKAE